MVSVRYDAVETPSRLVALDGGSRQQPRNVQNALLLSARGLSLSPAKITSLVITIRVLAFHITSSYISAFDYL